MKPAVENFAWLPVGAVSTKTGRGSVSLIQAGFQMGLFFGRSILSQKWGGPAGHPRPPHGAQAQRSRGGVLRPPPHCPADAGVPGRSALPLGHRPEHGLGEAPPRLDQPSIMALGGMGTGRKGAQRDATSGAAPICTVTETLGTLHYYCYVTARERGEGAALLIMLHAARHAHAFTLPP